MWDDEFWYEANNVKQWKLEPIILFSWARVPEQGKGFGLWLQLNATFFPKFNFIENIPKYLQINSFEVTEGNSGIASDICYSYAV